MIDLREYERLKARAADLERGASHAEGEHAAALKRLAKEFGCSSMAEAKKLLAALDEQEKAAADKFAKELTKFSAKWKHLEASK